jgi:hypothetical protein
MTDLITFIVELILNFFSQFAGNFPHTIWSHPSSASSREREPLQQQQQQQQEEEV